jgi:hypothetical protein
LVVLVILGVGINSIAAGLLGGFHLPTAGVFHKSALPNAQSPVTAEGSGHLTGLAQAGFAYLMPADDAGWKVDEPSAAYEDSKGIVKYNLQLTNARTVVTVSQQAMPAQLLPRKGSAFLTFIGDSKPTRSVEVNGGTLYYLPSLQNGVPAAGSDTVILVSDSVLLFGRAERVVGYDGWLALMTAMKPRNPK